MNNKYEKRACCSLGDWMIADHALKAYGISLNESGRLDPEVVAAAEVFTQRVLPRAAQIEGGSEKLGYSIIHKGMVGTWLLIHWWAHGDICCQRLAMAPHERPNFDPMDDRALMACVWEHVVIRHERNAWVRWMMTATPDSAGYCADRLPDGQY